MGPTCHDPAIRIRPTPTRVDEDTGQFLCNALHVSMLLNMNTCEALHRPKTNTLIISPIPSTLVLVPRRQVTSYEAIFNLFFLDLCLLNEKEKDTLATAVDLCVAEGWSLVRSAHLFQTF